MSEPARDRVPLNLAEEESSPGLRRRIVLIGVGYVALVLAVAAFAGVPLPEVPQATTIFATGVLVTDTSTFYLLLAIARQSRSWPILLLAGAYLFAALMVLLHLLTFPGAVFPAAPVLGGPQTVSWLFNIWRIGFPVLVMAALLAETASPGSRIEPRRFGRVAALYCAIMATAVAGPA